MNCVFYWCGCRKGFEGDEPPPYCAQHNDGVARVQMDEVEEVVEETGEEVPPETETPPEVPPEEPKLKPKTKPSKR